MPKKYTPSSAASDVEAALKLLEGRWKLVILFHLFGGKVLRYSDLERLIPNITQKMLGQQLRQMEADGIVVRKAYPQVPPKVSTVSQNGGKRCVPPWMPSSSGRSSVRRLESEVGLESLTY